MMSQMTVLKALYEHQNVTNTSVHLTTDEFNSSLSSLKEHGYIMRDNVGNIELTKKGSTLAKELYL